MSDTKDKKSKWGGLFHKDRPSSTTDSAYGSEGSRDSYNNGNGPSVSDSHEGKQPVQYVNDQGQVVTTTTTTTTTTTAGGGNAQSSTTPHDGDHMNRTDPRVNNNDIQSYEQGQGTAPNVPVRSNLRRDPSPNPSPQQVRQMNSMREPLPQHNNESGGCARNPEQMGQNFSYPSRGGISSQGQPQQPSTLHNIKAAAAGVHGAGETLRGTFNSAVDRRFNAPPEQIAAHNQVAQGGRAEIDSGHFNHNGRQAGGVGSGPIKGILRKTNEGRGTGVYDGR